MDIDQPSPGALKKRVHSQRKVRKKTESKFIAQVRRFQNYYLEINEALKWLDQVSEKNRQDLWWPSVFILMSSC